MDAFGALTKDDIFRHYISDHDLRSFNEGNDIGYKLNVFHLRYQKNLAQPIKVEFDFSEKVPAGIYGYALVLTKKILSISSQRRFDLF